MIARFWRYVRELYAATFVHEYTKVAAVHARQARELPTHLQVLLGALRLLVSSFALVECASTTATT